MLTDIEIAQAATPCPITEIAEKAGISEEYLECYGKTKAKVDYNLLRNEDHKPGKLVLVTAINPTAAGEGKTTTTVGLGDALSQVWAKGGEGGVELAEEVMRLCEQESSLTFTYEDNMGLAEKIEAVAKRIYHADGVDFAPAAKKEIKQLEELGFGSMPVCMAKTQYSFSDDAALLGAPRNFRITVRQVKVSAGAGFVVALTGIVMTMPGLGKAPAAFKIDVDETGKISGLF